GAALSRLGTNHVRHDAQSGARHSDEPQLSFALPDRRNSLWKALVGRAAPARFFHGFERAIRVAAGPAYPAAFLLRGHRRSGAGTGRISASRIRAGVAGSDPGS